MSITASNITDPTFLKLTSTQQAAYLAQGVLMFTAQALKSSITIASIATPTPYIPLRMQVVFVLIAMCKDLVGSDFREIRDGLSIDTYQAKLKTLTDEMGELIMSFTPTMCGYEDDTINTGTGSITVAWGRE
jgi:hypothetical protein